ncbi:hypothetical protein SLEP1_g56424 [Rubroshorea leprosula]|uniref:Wall-associated receptor kinase galacturonan-binding domain-containing protein n=1 Tax=Rubroshorea leprosula TaxID=152421 RepID=A0AAV5MI96_9ROSI|nr:hypothetical protein SLEP1_g56424 [Rubroshorea leprosula]
MQMKLLLWMVVMMVILPSSTVTASSNISLENCPRTCGSVSVPFPFGFGRTECAKNDSFLLECNKTGSLLFGDISISDISLENGTITGLVNSSAYRCWLEDGSDWIFRDGNIAFNKPSNKLAFIISPIHNKFVGLGCDTVAFIAGDYGTTFASGCYAFCTNVT